MKNSRISRIIQLLTTIQAGKSYAVEDLSKMFGTSRRTIFRDLKELQSIGVPYHFDSNAGGYVIDPEFFLPPVDLDLKEALSLLLLVHKVRGEIQLPFSRSAMLAALKIENNLPPNIRRYCNIALKNIQITDTCFVGGEDFNAQEHFGRAWSMIPEGRIYNVKLQFLPKVAANVTEVKWHSTQQVTYNSDGSAVVEFRIDGLGEISWWILGYGDQVRVLAPRALRKRILDVAKNMITVNEKG